MAVVGDTVEAAAVVETDDDAAVVLGLVRGRAGAAGATAIATATVIATERKRNAGTEVSRRIARIAVQRLKQSA